MVRSKTVIATPPGATIKEQLIDRMISQKEFALRMGMSEKHISRLINGEVLLTSDVAVRLEMVLGIPALFWLNLEAVYQDKLAKVKAENNLDADIEIAKKLPYNEMAKSGWVPVTREASEKVINLRKYFEVAQLAYIDRPALLGIACRRLAETKRSDYVLVAWAQKAKLEARNVSVKAIDINGFEKQLPEIRKMTRMQPEQFCERLVELLAQYGIALVFLPHIGGSFLHGATFYDGRKIVVGMTVRGKDADKFWFSLFHEFAHIIYNHIGQADGTSDADEKAADNFAKNCLIPSQPFESFIQGRNFSKEAMIYFAEQIGVDVGIVVGRLQKDGYIKFDWYNDLKTKYVIAG